MTDSLDRLNDALADRYAVDRELGRGGMATVYLARDLKHRRPVAMKVLRPKLATALGPERFLQEIEIEARLAHPHILPLLDSGEADGLLWYTMPFVEGESLRERLDREGPLPLDEALRITREVADALGYAHRRGVIHRDVKPANILLEAGHAVVSDFGIARAVHAAGEARLTETGMAVGTAAYMSPEQAAGGHELDGRSDLYSLGCVLYEMLTGDPPFTDTNPQAILARKITEDPRPVRAVRPTVSEALEDVQLRVLARVPADRFTTAEELIRVLEPGTLGAAGPRASPVDRLLQKRKTLVVAAVVVAVVGGALALTQWRLGGTGSDSSPTGPILREGRFPLTTIAVLPFDVLNEEGATVQVAGEQHPVADIAGGIYTTLVTELTQIGDLTVRDRELVTPFAEAPLGQIADELLVGSVVRSEFQLLRGQLSLNVTLVDVATGSNLWAQIYRESLDSVFAVQSRIARAIVEKVGAELTAAEAAALADAAPTDDREALTRYLQGEEYYNRPVSTQNFEIAQQHFERALEKDPGIAEAHARLSMIHGYYHWMGWDRKEVRRQRELWEAREALRLDPNLPLAHLAMGSAYYHAFDYDSAFVEYEKAKPGMNGDAEFWKILGSLYRRQGRWDDAFDAYRRSMELNRQDADLYADGHASSYWATHRYAEAIDWFDRSLELAPDLKWAAVDKGWMYYFRDGQADTLRAALDSLSPDDDLGHHLGQPAAERARLYLLVRRADGLLSLVRSAAGWPLLNMHEYIPKSLLEAWAHRLRGDDAEAQRAFETACEALDLVVGPLSDDWRIHAARGFAFAGLGQRDEALQEVRLLEQTDIYRKDAFLGLSPKEARARILAQVGDAEGAVEELKHLLGEASFYVTARTVRLDPLFDPIREDQRFQELLEAYPVPSAPDGAE